MRTVTFFDDHHDALFCNRCGLPLKRTDHITRYSEKTGAPIGKTVKLICPDFRSSTSHGHFLLEWDEPL